MYSTIMIFIYSISIFLIFWTYIGYYLLLRAVLIFRSYKIIKEDYTNKISIIITAYNEQNRIKEKIENVLSLDFPKDRREIIVVSDGSTDDTVNIARSFEKVGVIVLEFCDRRGKHNCQGEGIRRAKNDVIVLSDATTFLEKDSVKNLVNSFVDPNIGCVSGLDGIRDTSDGKSGEGAYVKYEMKVRELESRVGSLVGVSGSFFAVRKSLCDIWYPNLSSDFYLPLLIRMRGYRSVLETSAIGYYTVLKDHKMEFRRKVRTIVHGMDVLYNVKKVLNPFRYGFFAIQVLSHKLIRWLVPFCLIFIFISNLFLLERSMLFKLSFALQILFYFAASLGQFAKFKKIFVFKIPLFFVMANYSILVAWYKFAMGEKYVLWDSTKR